MERQRYEEHVATPLRAFAAGLAPGVVLTEAPAAIGLAVEVLLRDAGSGVGVGSTDGVVVDLAWRVGPGSVGVAGRVWVGVAGPVVPVMAVVGLGGEVAATVSVGASTVRSDRVLLAGDDGAVVPHVAVVRRLVPVEWTPVVVLGPDDLEG